MTKNISGPQIYLYIYSLAETQDCVDYINLLLIDYNLNKKYEKYIENEKNGKYILHGIYCIHNSLSLLCDDYITKNNIPEPPIKINELTPNDILVKFIHS